jgi:hypothetical protein
MKLFQVVYTQTINCSSHVKAETMEDACEQIKERLKNMGKHYDSSSMHVREVIEPDEK